MTKKLKDLPYPDNKRFDAAEGWLEGRCEVVGWLGVLASSIVSNPKALALVRVPTETEERQRTQTRLRQSLVRDLKMIAGRARGLALQYGFSLKGPWYGRRSWPKWQRELPVWLTQLLEPLHASALFLHDRVKQPTDTITAASQRARPKGMGGLTEQVLEREVGDWTRFKNRRQVSSYPGLCPGENSSGQRHQQSHVTKCGNPRLRWALAEMAWRLIRFQPDYRLTRKWKPRIADPHATPGRRKQALVALARGFGVDWWRLCTGQTTPEKLGLKMGGQ